MNEPARLLNIGCGHVWNDAWINLDGAPGDSAIRRHDITLGLPFDDASIDACYASHVLEHLTRAQAGALVGEMHRVLRPGGIARIVVPDLEAIVRLYQQLLGQLASGDASREQDYDWVMLELLDQVARDAQGGDMGRFLSRSPLSNREFVVSRIGDEAERFWARRGTPLSVRIGAKLRAGGWRWAASWLRNRIAAWAVLGLAGRRGKAAFEAGLFRQSGEVHRWMYDRFSLARLLRDAGFGDIAVCTAHESRIPGFISHDLDTIEGRVRKPDSLFVEAARTAHLRE